MPTKSRPKVRPERFQAVRPRVQPGESWMGVRELEEKYALSHGQIRYWIQTEVIPADQIKEPVTRGGKRLIDEAAVWLAWTTKYNSYKAPKTSRGVVIPADPTLLGDQDRYLPPQILHRGAPISSIAQTELPDDHIPMAHVVQAFLDHRTFLVSQREAARKRGEKHPRVGIDPKTLWGDENFAKKWALQVEAFPWTHADIDRFEQSIGARASLWHARRFVVKLANWAKDRYTINGRSVQLPKPKVGQYEGKKVTPLPPGLEAACRQALLDHAPYSVYVYAMTVAETGCRSFELLDADWADLQPHGLRTYGRRAKKAGMLYFPKAVYDRIMTLPEPHEGPIFKNSQGKRQLTETMDRHMIDAYRKAGLSFEGKKGAYLWRHLYAAKVKDHVPPTRLADLMRTSVKYIQDTYGQQSDASYLAIVEDVHANLFGGQAQATEALG